MRSTLFFTLLLTLASPAAAGAAGAAYHPRFGAPWRVLQTPQAWEAGQFPHTLSVLELKRKGRRYWGWYGLNGGRGVGLAFSNDLVRWEKFEGNPLLSDARWPAVLPGRGKGEPLAYAAFERRYDYAVEPSSAGYTVRLSSSYIALASTRDGVHWEGFSTLVPPVDGERRQNPNLFRDPASGRVYLTYYRGNDKDRYEIVGRSAGRVQDLAGAEDRVLLRSTWTLAGPFLTYRPASGSEPARYLLFVEVFGHMAGQQPEWMVADFTAPSPEGPFATVDLPLLRGDRGCPFIHSFGGRSVGFFCRRLDARAQTWALEAAEGDPLPAAAP